jgi:CDGSH-type Zn-finger protein
MAERSTLAGGALMRVYPDGPLLVRGDFSILDENGKIIGIKRRTVSLCRCGRSSLAPICDGTHARRSRAARAITAPPGADEACEPA